MTMLNFLASTLFATPAASATLSIKDMPIADPRNRPQPRPTAAAPLLVFNNGV
jgi:hypothetical protein